MAIKEPVLAASPQWICVANSNEQQQLQHGRDAVSDLKDVNKPNAKKHNVLLMTSINYPNQ